MSAIPNLPPTVTRTIHHASIDCSLAQMHVAAGTISPPHQHPHATVLYMLQGSCLFILDEDQIYLEPGKSLYIPTNAMHGFIENDHDLLFLEFFVPGREDFI